MSSLKYLFMDKFHTYIWTEPKVYSNFLQMKKSKEFDFENILTTNSSCDPKQMRPLPIKSIIGNISAISRKLQSIQNFFCRCY